MLGVYFPVWMRTMGAMSDRKPPISAVPEPDDDSAELPFCAAFSITSPLAPLVRIVVTAHDEDTVAQVANAAVEEYASRRERTTPVRAPDVWWQNMARQFLQGLIVGAEAMGITGQRGPFPGGPVPRGPFRVYTTGQKEPPPVDEDFAGDPNKPPIA